MPDVISSICGAKSSSHAIRGGDDADGAVVHLWPCVAYRWACVGHRYRFGFVFYVLDQIFGPLTLVYGIPPIIGALLPSASFFS